MLSAEPSTNSPRRICVPGSAQMTRSAFHRVIYLMEGRALDACCADPSLQAVQRHLTMGAGLWFATLAFECQHSINPTNRSSGTRPLGGRLTPAFPTLPHLPKGSRYFGSRSGKCVRLGGLFRREIRINSGWRQSVPRAPDRLDERRLAGPVDLAA